MQTSLVNIKCSTDGDCCACTVGDYTKLPGTSYYCWEGSECTDYESCKEPDEKCAIASQSDFDKYWSGYDIAGTCNNLTVDCAALGYDTCTAGTGVTCKDGTEPYRCPFDHTKVYCESGCSSSCEFITEADCELAYFGSNCTKDSAGCYNPTSCKTGYGKTTAQCSNGEAGNWTLGSADEYGCALCQCENTCVNKISTVPGNATAVYETCTACNQTTQIITDFKCNEGYTKSQDGTACVAACGPEFNLTSCPTNGICSECGGLFKLDQCQSGYTLSNNTCVEAIPEIIITYYEKTLYCTGVNLGNKAYDVGTVYGNLICPNGEVSATYALNDAFEFYINYIEADIGQMCYVPDRFVSRAEVAAGVKQGSQTISCPEGSSSKLKITFKYYKY